MPRLRPAAPTYARALALIEQLAFRFAVRDSKAKKPHIPHEYTARDKQDAAHEAAYVELFRLVQADGEIERWRGRKPRFLYSGDVAHNSTAPSTATSH